MDRWQKAPITRVVRLVTIPVLFLSLMMLALADSPIPGLTTFLPVSSTMTRTTDQSKPPGSPPGGGSATSSAQPTARDATTMAYDAAIRRVVLFGGCCAAGNHLNDTWTWDGSTWSQQQPAMSPPARRSAAMDYDAATGRIILFGGNRNRGGFLDDTWSWDGTTWTNLNLATKPPVRYASQMTYGAAIQSLVLFGGYGLPCSQTNGAGTILNDTWVFNGTTWSQKSGPKPAAKAPIAPSPFAPAPVLAAGHPLQPTSLPADWLQFGGDQLHQSDNTQETTIDASNVRQLQKLFQVSVPSSANDAPVYLTGVTTPLGVKDLLYVSTEAGHILALDAHTGSQIWSNQYGPGSCQFPAYGRACFSLASPAIDPNRQFVYSYGLDGYVHKFRVGDGSEVTGGGWPELITLKTSIEKESSSLGIGTTPGGTSFLYVTTASAGDLGDYQGHLTAINLTDGSQHVFNALCSSVRSRYRESLRRDRQRCLCPEQPRLGRGRPGA